MFKENNLSNFIQNILYQCAKRALYYYSTIFVMFEDTINHGYTNYTWVKYSLDAFYYYKQKTINYVYDIKSYPENNWHNIIQINEKENTYNYTEKYDIIKDALNERNFFINMKDKYSTLYDCENKNIVSLISKFNNIWCVQHTPGYVKQDDIFEKSTMEILSVNYSHPEMNEPIELTLNKDLLYCHNQLFNAAFIYHCLQYQDKPYVFDFKYNVEVMDSDVNSFTFGYNEYLHVYKNELKVHSFIVPSESIE